MNSKWRFFKQLSYLDAALDKDCSHLKSENEESSIDLDLSSKHSDEIETVDLVSSDEENEISSSNINLQDIDPETTEEERASTSSDMVENSNVPIPSHEFLENSINIKHELSQTLEDEELPPEEFDLMCAPKVEVEMKESVDQQDETPTSSENCRNDCDGFEYPRTDYTNFGNFVLLGLNTMTKPLRNKKVLQIFDVLSENFGHFIADTLNRMPFEEGQSKQNEIVKLLMMKR